MRAKKAPTRATCAPTSACIQAGGANGTVHQHHGVNINRNCPLRISEAGASKRREAGMRRAGPCSGACNIKCRDESRRGRAGYTHELGWCMRRHDDGAAGGAPHAGDALPGRHAHALQRARAAAPGHQGGPCRLLPESVDRPLAAAARDCRAALPCAVRVGCTGVPTRFLAASGRCTGTWCAGGGGSMVKAGCLDRHLPHGGAR